MGDTARQHSAALSESDLAMLHGVLAGYPSGPGVEARVLALVARVEEAAEERERDQAVANERAARKVLGLPTLNARTMSENIRLQRELESERGRVEQLAEALRDGLMPLATAVLVLTEAPGNDLPDAVFNLAAAVHRYAALAAAGDAGDET